MKILFTNLIILLFVLGLSSCSSSSDEDKSQKSVQVVLKEEQQKPNNDNVFYQVPTPNELFAVLKNSNVPFNEEILNDPSIQKTILQNFQNH
jgi:hypothetical protein